MKLFLHVKYCTLSIYIFQHNTPDIERTTSTEITIQSWQVKPSTAAKS